MLRRLLSKLLGLDKRNGSQYRPYRSSDDYRRPSNGNKYNQHNQYGNSHYKKKRSSSSYSS
ncbi:MULTISPECIES: hypothetical protein [Paenibacillus]|uniref:Uncharacterized protein n=1 Tax=Paenibacillus radicis (ex Xue et al. 2023) TaxID=2972489 RepID=A0ABT1YNJ7_9BACL|nr:hypothetical protein [Paenibacillus radicis (ex Xue et al. 2023)]MCR8634750.1 hypothetical protein [Paenibacillus radicis (ex Xue et al. 2023)]